MMLREILKVTRIQSYRDILQHNILKLLFTLSPLIRINRRC